MEKSKNHLDKKSNKTEKSNNFESQSNFEKTEETKYIENQINLAKKSIKTEKTSNLDKNTNKTEKTNLIDCQTNIDKKSIKTEKASADESLNNKSIKKSYKKDQKETSGNILKNENSSLYQKKNAGYGDKINDDVFTAKSPISASLISTDDEKNEASETDEPCCFKDQSKNIVSKRSTSGTNKETDDDSDYDLTLDQFIKLQALKASDKSNVSATKGESSSKTSKSSNKDIDKKPKKDGESSKHKKEKDTSKSKNHDKEQKTPKKEDKLSKKDPKSLAKFLKKEKSKSRKDEKSKHKKVGSSSSKSKKDYDKDASKSSKKDSEDFLLSNFGNSSIDHSENKKDKTKKDSKLSRSSSCDETKSPKKKKKHNEFKDIEKIKNLISKSSILSEFSGFKEFKRRSSSDKSELKKSKKKKKLALLKDKKLSKKLSSKLLRKYSKKKGLKSKKKLRKKELKGMKISELESKILSKSKKQKHKLKSKESGDKSKSSDTATSASSSKTMNINSASETDQQFAKVTESVTTNSSNVVNNSTTCCSSTGNNVSTYIIESIPDVIPPIDTISTQSIAASTEQYVFSSADELQGIVASDFSSVFEETFPSGAILLATRDTISQVPVHFIQDMPTPKKMADAATDTGEDDIAENLEISDNSKSDEMSVGTQTMTPVGSPTVEIQPLVLPKNIELSLGEKARQELKSSSVPSVTLTKTASTTVPLKSTPAVALVKTTVAATSVKSSIAISPIKTTPTVTLVKPSVAINPTVTLVKSSVATSPTVTLVKSSVATSPTVTLVKSSVATSPTVTMKPSVVTTPIKTTANVTLVTPSVATTPTVTMKPTVTTTPTVTLVKPSVSTTPTVTVKPSVSTTPTLLKPSVATIPTVTLGNPSITVTPVTVTPSVYPGKTAATVTPIKSAVTVTPLKTTPAVTLMEPTVASPVKTTPAVSLVKSTVAVTPVITTPTVALLKSSLPEVTVKLTPEVTVKPSVTITPVKSSITITPLKSPSVTLVKTTLASSPAKTTVTITPTKTTPLVTPTKNIQAEIPSKPALSVKSASTTPVKTASASNKSVALNVSGETTSVSPKPKRRSSFVKKSKTQQSFLLPEGQPFPLDSAKMVSAPVYYPTAEEFRDPLEYIFKIQNEAAQFGICKIVPPSSFKPECKVNDDMRFTAHNQYLHKMLNRWGPNVQHTACIKKHLKSQKVKLEQAPLIGGIELDISRFYHTVQQYGGLQQVIEKKKWQRVADTLRVPKTAQDRVTKLYDAYCRYLVSYDTLPKEEKAKLENEVITDHERRVKLRNSPKDPEKEEEDFDEEENTDCVSKGRSMSLSNFFRIARNIMNMWFKNEPPPDEVEHEYWKVVTEGQQHVVVHAGNIDSSVSQSGFACNRNSPFAKHPWNLKILTNNSNSILRCMGPVSGVTTPTLHVGMLFTTGCWYRDPHSLPWIEYLHTGASKIWYSIPSKGCEKFRESMKKIMPEYCTNNPIWLPSDTAMVPPELLVQEGASLSRTIQNSGQFIVIFPEAFTSTICCGYCVSESVYFAPSSWLDLAIKTFKDIQSSCEPPSFSLERLLLSIATELKTSIETLQKILPLIQNIRLKDTHLRAQLSEVGLKQWERLPVPDAKDKKKKSKIEDDYELECEVCRTHCYLSMVVAVLDETVYCLPHALEQIPKKNLKLCKLKYRYDENDLKALETSVMDHITQNLAKLSKKKSPKKKLTPAPDK